jgi:hypothetical protein
MKKGIISIAVSMGMLAAFLSTGTASAAGEPAVVVDDIVEFTENIPAAESICGVDVTIDVTFKIRVTEWYDRDDELVRVQAHLNGTTLLTTENGTAIDRWSQNEFLDPETLVQTVAGTPYNLHVPGSGTGVLVNDSGLLKIDVTTGDAVFVAGPHPVFFDEEAAFAEVCALGSP